MDLTIEVFETDDDGFLPRACPACERQFRWPEPTSEAVEDAGSYFCPYCGQEAAEQYWFTDAQYEDLVALLSLLPRHSPPSSMFAATLLALVERHGPDVVPTSNQRDDCYPTYRTVTCPCHGEIWKVEQSWSMPLWCLLTGDMFTCSAHVA